MFSSLILFVDMNNSNGMAKAKGNFSNALWYNYWQIRFKSHKFCYFNRSQLLKKFQLREEVLLT